MPGVDYEEPRMAEVVRIVTDFRAEFREAMNTVVRKDVYMANMDTLRAEMAIIKAENARLDAELRQDRLERSRDLTERRNLRTGLILAASGAGFSMIGTAILAVMK